MSYVFAKSDHDLGCAEEIEHEIRLTDKIPVREPYRKVPQGQLEEFRTAMKDLLDPGVIRESKSPYASPVVLESMCGFQEVKRQDNPRLLSTAEDNGNP